MVFHLAMCGHSIFEIQVSQVSLDGIDVGICALKVVN